MKRLIFILTSILIFNLGSNAQTFSVNLSGQVTDSTGNGVPNIPVTYNTMNLTAVVLTNANGFYQDSFAVQGPDSLIVLITDCNGNTIINDYVVNPNNNNIVSNFVYCGSSVIPCNGTITQTINGTTGVFTLNTQQPGGNFQWDINGTQYQGNNVSHTFPGPGLYSACVSYSSFICSFTVCDSVLITANPPSIFSFGGLVNKTNGPASSGLVVLFSIDSTGSGSTFTAIDTVAIDSGTYWFTNVAAGSYTTMAMLDPNDTDFMGYFPTYYGDVVTWTSASSFIVNNNLFDKDINLVAIPAAAPGPGNLTGSVIEGPNKVVGPGDPIKDVMVHLRDDNGNELEFDMTDSNGDFDFSNIAYGSYELMLEIPGVNTNPHFVIINWGQGSINTVFEVDTLGVRVVILGMNNSLLEQKAKIFPNPISNDISVDLSGIEIDNAEIRIIDIQGREIYNKRMESDFQRIDLSDAKEGVYFLRINSDVGELNRKVVKK